METVVGLAIRRVTEIEYMLLSPHWLLIVFSRILFLFLMVNRYIYL